MITFGANLKINNNIYDRLTTEEAKDFVKKTAEEYRQFVEHPNFEALTKEDTIELRRGKRCNGYALELEITGPDLEKPYVTGVYTNKREPTIKTCELIVQTLLYLCFKSGAEPKFSEDPIDYIDRVLFDGKLKRLKQAEDNE